MNGKNAPTIVKIIAVLYYIAAALILFLPILLLVGGLSEFGVLGGLIGLGLGFGLLIIAVPFAILFFFVARGLWKGQKWSRIVAIIIAILGFLGGLSSITTVNGISNIVVEGFIAGYLLFSKQVKTFFA